jgi:hypothetical protein
VLLTRARVVWRGVGAAVSLYCFDRIYHQFRGILGGVDVYGYSHCNIMTEDLRISLRN